MINIDGSVGLGVNETETFKQLCPDGHVTLNHVYQIYNRWFKFNNTDRIDVVLATALTQRHDGIPIWLILIAPSGDGKSEQIMAVHDGTTTKIIHEFTSRTLVSGSRNVQDLAPQLNNKIVLIPDMAQLLKLAPDEKARVWAQLRELYDGRAGRRTAMKEDPDYSGLKITIIAGSTPAIDSQILIHQDLGTRELFYRIEETDKLEEKVWDDEGFETQMRKELNWITTEFLKQHTIKEVDISEDVRDKIFAYVDYLRYMRAVTETDSYTGELINLVYPEKPTRCLKQLKKFFIALKSLDEKYTNETALRIIKDIVKSSSLPIRVKVLDHILACNSSMTTNEIIKKVRIGTKTAVKELNILWHLNLINKDEVMDFTSYGKEYVKETNWSINRKKKL